MAAAATLIAGAIVAAFCDTETRGHKSGVGIQVTRPPKRAVDHGYCVRNRFVICHLSPCSAVIPMWLRSLFEQSIDDEDDITNSGDDNTRR
jgi:hypothetical protein